MICIYISNIVQCAMLRTFCGHDGDVAAGGYLVDCLSELHSLESWSMSSHESRF